MHNFTRKRNSQFTIEKQVIIGFNDFTITYAPQNPTDSFFSNLQANNETFKGAILLQITSCLTTVVSGMSI
jgi:hypothetical protein